MLGMIGADAPAARGGPVNGERPRLVVSTKKCKPPVDGPSLARFVEFCERHHYEYRLSLKQLGRDAAAGQRKGTIPYPVQRLRDFNWFFGFCIENREPGGDVLLLGVHDPGRPALDIGQLATAIEAVAGRREPSCSLEPAADQSWQQSIVRGVPWQTRWAQVMISADYEMKGIAQGFHPAFGVPSYVERKAAALMQSQAPQGGQQMQPQMPSQQQPQAKETNRWWFTRSAKDDAPRSVVLAEGSEGRGADLVILFRNPVVLMTEQEVNGKFGTGVVGTEAEGFATDFTTHMEQIGHRYSSIGSLLSLFRLLDIMLHLRVVGQVEPPEMQFWLHEYRSKSKGPPAYVPSLWRYCWYAQDNALREIWVTGGVRMPLRLNTAAVKVDQAHGLKRRIAALTPDPAAAPPE
jgi:hypothetical protein